MWSSAEATPKRWSGISDRTFLCGIWDLGWDLFRWDLFPWYASIRPVPPPSRRIQNSDADAVVHTFRIICPSTPPTLPVVCYNFKGHHRTMLQPPYAHSRKYVSEVAGQTVVSNRNGYGQKIYIGHVVAHVTSPSRDWAANPVVPPMAQLAAGCFRLIFFSGIFLYQWDFRFSVGSCLSKRWDSLHRFGNSCRLLEGG